METLLTTEYPAPAALLPHQPPMLLIDKILDYRPGVSLVASKVVRGEEPFFDGHFPGNPILPGVIMVEMMFQACGLYGRLDASQGQGAGKSGRAIRITEASFRKEVSPGTELTILVYFKHKLMSFSVYDAEVRSGKDLVANATITATIS